MAKKVEKKKDKIKTEKLDLTKEMAVRGRGTQEIKDGSVKQEIIKGHISLVQAIAANVAGSGKAPPGITFNDLVSYGVEGLVKAWESFDRNRGVQFKVYASYRIRGEILDRIRKEWKYRNPGSYKSFQNRASSKVSELASEVVKGAEGEGELGEVKDVVTNSAIVYLLSMEEIEVQSGVQGTHDPAEEVISNMEFSRERAALWEEIKKLTAPEKMLVNMFYVEDKNQKEIADALGFSKSKVSRLHMQVLNKLKGRLKRKMSP
ncbi:MAG: sigma-70 family RNA polymerase sigma factor [Candidatus Margulisbacteria bacterium]|nr:sigma-70 family RNA polymerase sigma factor [Candidatus Margulisiibacteriota bacterium]